MKKCTKFDTYSNEPCKCKRNYHKLKLATLESFLHDVENDRCEFNQVLNILDYNDLKYLIEQTKKVEGCG